AAPHAIRRMPNGHVTLYDNGNFHWPPYSRAVEYALDEVNKVATLVWQFDDAQSYSFAMGYVERMDDGSTLIGFGVGPPDAVELRPNGSVSAVLNLPPDQV